MTDRGLLEAAAKAAGYWSAEFNCPDRLPANWDPLTDDGDALRLAVKLRLVVDTGGVMPRSERIYVGGSEGFLAAEPTGADIHAATRRAIVRAAAIVSTPPAKDAT